MIDIYDLIYLFIYRYLYISIETQRNMPTINIYLSEELFEYVKNNKSKIIQEALKEFKEKHTPPSKNSLTTLTDNIS